MVDVGIAEALRRSLTFGKIRSVITVSHVKRHIQPVSPGTWRKKTNTELKAFPVRGPQ